MKCECGGDMKHHDKAVRIVREKGGAKHRIYIERVKCEKDFSRKYFTAQAVR